MFIYNFIDDCIIYFEFNNKITQLDFNKYTQIMNIIYSKKEKVKLIYNLKDAKISLKLLFTQLNHMKKNEENTNNYIIKSSIIVNKKIVNLINLLFILKKPKHEYLITNNLKESLLFINK